ncbi:winged helix-turn-helix transcriptional regulator [Treponema vincentii]|jgi:hypothetical protein|uniref:winged helix-turn-helix transcriptional regulator n=1 Tax=Treponema vincentii TaxID=69710 RepID=UPI0039BEE014
MDVQFGAVALKNLMKNGIIEREQLDGISPYVQYRFREQGKSVVSILCSICFMLNLQVGNKDSLTIRVFIGKIRRAIYKTA